MGRNQPHDSVPRYLGNVLPILFSEWYANLPRRGLSRLFPFVLKWPVLPHHAVAIHRQNDSYFYRKEELLHHERTQKSRMNVLLDFLGKGLLGEFVHKTCP